ncbi:hypothetical protein [Lacipirellula parvula]|uniref:Proteinase inhibitor I42 chagasin domain-containing protein n=1 Tax=Lacipirellula parvula TaxID=2650471 RepID=A0A5K7XLZ7_9BACT|nr:hypothetical protein [Lacipirellula parvula]BBO35736.1 hypothetical protein PLANPX_5348 [Lacipirellula parvula]
MNAYRSAALGLLVTAVAASTLIAQETNERREKIRRAVGAAAEVAEGLIEQNANTAVPAVDGRVIILKRVEKKDEALATEPQEINAGGLVIVEVPDTQSHPTEVAEPTVTPAEAAQSFGKVRGIRTNNAGQPMMGGGYTWFLFKTLAPGKAAINVKYTPNGGGDPVDQTYQVNVVAK